MNRTYTDLIKFISAIAIFVHHFYLKNPAVTSLGFVACGVFFFFSAYGISKSLQHNPIRFGNFCKKRLLKIYMPLLLVNLITLLLVSPICNDGSFGIPKLSCILRQYNNFARVQYSGCNTVFDGMEENGFGDMVLGCPARILYSHLGY